ncbi:MAG TPA: YeeE/YedE thiosulfate transporter family protein, partial [Thermodesulfovibrionales bacterium]|nr:YeeE/YedE thiosulfate transporter family protein [Thermodesulfovibrionales bacterium]
METTDTKERGNQIWAFIVTGALIVISLMYYNVNVYYMYLLVYIWFGFAYGMMLQYGRFCMASASRDLFAAGVPRMAVGIMVALMFFSIIQATLSATSMSTFHPAPFGIHTLISGVIFGVGMVLAGGCASGSLYKIGEGNGTSMLAILGISFGQAIFSVVPWFNSIIPQSWIDSAKAKDLPVSLNASFDKYLA